MYLSQNPNNNNKNITSFTLDVKRRKTEYNSRLDSKLQYFKAMNQFSMYTHVTTLRLVLIFYC